MYQKETQLKIDGKIKLLDSTFLMSCGWGESENEEGKNENITVYFF